MSAAARVGVIGYGAIGRDLVARLRRDGHAVVLVLRPGSPSVKAVPPGVAVVDSVSALVSARPDLVVEAAGQQVLAEAGETILAAGLTVVAASTGALAEPSVYAAFEAAARAGGSRLVIPSGALGGLDYLAALRQTPGTSVRYTSRKPVAAWRAELDTAGLDADALSRETVLFEGSAAEAARRYPRNLNAGLTVALAAAPVPVTVRVVADPAVTLNTHEIEAEGPLGTAVLRFANRPAPDNPKTSALTAASLAAAVRRLLAPVVV